MKTKEQEIKQFAKETFMDIVREECEDELSNGRDIEELYDGGKMHWYMEGAQLGYNIARADLLSLNSNLLTMAENVDLAVKERDRLKEVLDGIEKTLREIALSEVSEQVYSLCLSAILQITNTK